MIAAKVSNLRKLLVLNIFFKHAVLLTSSDFCHNFMSTLHVGLWSITMQLQPLNHAKCLSLKCPISMQNDRVSSTLLCVWGAGGAD